MDISEMTLLQSDGRFVSVLTRGTLDDSQQQSTVDFALDPVEHGQTETEHVACRVADIANRAKSEFLSTLSHELRTPLNAMLGYAQLLSQDSGLNERQRRSIQTIRASGDHLLSLIVDILDLSRIEAKRFELVPTPVQLEPFLRSVADVMRAKADEKGLILALDAAPDLPAVLVDQRRLRQVLLNLLGNAVKFTDRGTVYLYVRDEDRENGHSLAKGCCLC